MTDDNDTRGTEGYGRVLEARWQAPHEEGRPDEWCDRLPEHVDNAPPPSTYRWVVDAMEGEAAFLLRHVAGWSEEEAERKAREMRPSWERRAAFEYRAEKCLEELIRATERYEATKRRLEVAA